MTGLIILYSIAGCLVYISCGFGVKNLLVAAEDSMSGFPLVPIIWPIVLCIYAYGDDYLRKNK